MKDICHICTAKAEHIWENDAGDKFCLCSVCYESMIDTSLPKLKVKRLRDNAKLPTYATDGSGGLDIYSCEDKPTYVRMGDGPIKFKTGIAIEIPPGYVGLIKGRSGMAFKVGVFSFGGVIDYDYRGEVQGLLYNIGRNTQVYNPGERIFQIVIVPVHRFDVVEVEELGETGRGNSGFGSSGI